MLLKNKDLLQFKVKNEVDKILLNSVALEFDQAKVLYDETNGKNANKTNKK